MNYDPTAIERHKATCPTPDVPHRVCFEDGCPQAGTVVHAPDGMTGAQAHQDHQQWHRNRATRAEQERAYADRDRQRDELLAAAYARWMSHGRAPVDPPAATTG